ncbi:hypothetical protein V6N12_053804 [Hibiscus sabdariffa]|uniref:Uncharacterized protein n=1 Tax=Hibiscus sabdariffa TaxID=183260 RepID=A0ABR2DAC6_9ROSI
MDTDASPSASAPPPFQINNGKHTFTLDDVPSTRFTEILRDWWNSLCQPDQVAFLIRQSFPEEARKLTEHARTQDSKSNVKKEEIAIADRRGTFEEEERINTLSERQPIPEV